MFSGSCGGSPKATERDYLGCRTVPQGGPYQNTATVRRSQVEARVLDTLGGELMRPEWVAAFVADVTFIIPVSPRTNGCPGKPGAARHSLPGTTYRTFVKRRIASRRGTAISPNPIQGSRGNFPLARPVT